MLVRNRTTLLIRDGGFGRVEEITVNAPIMFRASDSPQQGPCVYLESRTRVSDGQIRELASTLLLPWTGKPQIPQHQTKAKSLCGSFRVCGPQLPVFLDVVA